MWGSRLPNPVFSSRSSAASLLRSYLRKGSAALERKKKYVLKTTGFDDPSLT